MRNQNLRDRNRDGSYGGNGITLVPYVNLDGWSAPDEWVLRAWDLMQSEGTAETTFPLGVISRDDFLAYMQMSINFPVFLSNGSAVGVAWLNHIEGPTARAHFWASKSLWGYPALEAAQAVMNYWFSWGTIKVILGRIPAFNRRAIRFAERIGCKTFGPIPFAHFGMDATYTYITKDMVRNMNGD